MTKQEFYDIICKLNDKFQNRDLETYLSAVLLLVDKQKNQVLDVENLLSIIQTAFTSEAIEFNEEWLNITTAPDKNIMSRKFTNPEVKSQFDKSIASEKTGFEFTTEVLKFQISELYKMRENQLKNEMRYFGIQSVTGNLWYNFDPFTNLECGASCMLDSEDDADRELIVTWQTLGELLEMGRIYE
jgi:hypothetical protein